MDVAAELGTENRMCIVHAWASAVRTVHEECTAYPGASDLCNAERGRERKEEVRKIPGNALAHLVVSGRVVPTSGYFVDGDSVGAVAETVACQADIALIQKGYGNFLGQR
jgi:hypothetical protein